MVTIVNQIEKDQEHFVPNLLLIQNFTITEKAVNFSAICYHRINKPHEALLNRYGDLFDYTIVHSGDSGVADKDFLIKYDLVLFLRQIENFKIVDILKKEGIPFGIDIDDYWILNKEHTLFNAYNEGITNSIIKSIKASDFVITTTKILRDKILELNKNVYIIENGIDTLDPIWQPNKVKSNRIRFGFLQGGQHKDDIYMINLEVQKALKDKLFKEKGQVLLPFKFGEDSIYVVYEKMLTDYLSVFEFEHRKELYRNVVNNNRPYKRLEYKTTEEFGQLYNDLDISVCPLVKNEFNSCKSELKMLEAGFMDCAVMVSDVSPYKEIATSENSFLFSERDFYYWSRYILNNPNCVADKKAALKETVKRYDLNLLAEKRKQIYEEVLTLKKKSCLV